MFLPVVCGVMEGRGVTCRIIGQGNERYQNKGYIDYPCT